MRIISSFAVSSFIVALAIAAPARPPANLLVNGSFEDGPDDIGEFKSLDKGSDAIKGWKVTRGQIDLVGTFWPAAHGKRSIDLHGSPGYGGIEQTVKTKKGTKYKVELQLAATPAAGDRGIWVAAAGEKKQFDANPKDSTREKLNWIKVS